MGHRVALTVLATPMVSVVFIISAATGVARAAAPMHPYKVQPARTCLVRHHAHLAPTKYTILSQESGALPPTNWIVMTFSPSPARSATFERERKRSLRSTGLGKAWLRHHVTRRANVVIENDFLHHPLTAGQLATITGCLSRAT